MIGVYDSGVGGLSVLKALQAQLPHEHFVYLADSAHAPYGERGDAHVIARASAVMRYLRATHRLKAMVVACNTATTAAIQQLRAEHPDLALVGVEPALKPAAALSRTKRIGVLGTRGTLSSSKFEALRATLVDQAEFVVLPCDGLALAIEQNVAQASPESELMVRHLCERFTGAMGPFGAAMGQMDTLVLGCTHYLFAAHHLSALLGDTVRIIETGEPVARQARRLLQAGGLLNLEGAGQVSLLTTSDPQLLEAATSRWLGLNLRAGTVSI